MENHPIPQDITGFQFKLIGDMTVKQLAYIGAGGVLAWILFSLPFPFLIKIPIGVGFALLGIALAFVPIDQRPMDLMLMTFFQDLFVPNQYVYQKIGGNLLIALPKTKSQKKATEASPQTQEKLQSYLKTIHKTAHSKLDEKEDAFLRSLSSKAPESTLLTSNPTQTIQQEAVAQAAKLIQTPVQEKPEQNHEVKIIIGDQIQQPQPPKPPEATAAGPKLVVKTDAPSQALGSSPNLISGITKDSRGNMLSNILVEVKDKDGNPVRAFKTNGLGQFSSATPLSNGAYTVLFEDPKGAHTFPAIELTASGMLLAPIEAVSEDAREKLRKELFS